MPRAGWRHMDAASRHPAHQVLSPASPVGAALAAGAASRAGAAGAALAAERGGVTGGGEGCGQGTARGYGDRGEEGAVIRFAVEGGFAHQMRTLQIEAGGTAVAVVSGRRSTSRLAERDVAAIVAELDRSGLFDEDRSFPPPQGADLQRYEIGYAGTTVVAHDTTVPPELAGAIRLLQAVLRAVQHQP